MKLYRYTTNFQHEVIGYPIELITFETIKETNKCYVIKRRKYENVDKINSKTCRYILKEGKKRYAYPTSEEALNNYIRRTKKHIQYVEEKIVITRIALAEAEKMNNELNQLKGSFICNL